MNRQRLGYQVLGVVFLLVVALFVSFTIALYRKAFTPVVPVRLETDAVGNQLQPGADVKVRGVLVGEVRTISTNGRTAVLDLALRPDRVAWIPDNVTARLLPKTLFGERYVSLVPPPDPGRPITAGAVISQDRSSAAIEIGKVLDDVLPVLRAVQPQKLATTLNALAQALDGRGKQAGQLMVQANNFLRELTPALPDLAADLAALPEVADTYAKAAPDALRALADLTTTSRTLVEQRDNLRTLYAAVTTTAVDLGSFLRVNQANLIGLTASARPTLEVLAKYAPEYPCVLGQLADQVPTADFTFGKGTDHPQMGKFTLTITASRGAYQPGVDTPKYQDTRGPQCYQKASGGNLFPQYPPGGPIRDGSTKPAAASLPGSPAEQQLVSTLLAPGLGGSPTNGPQWSALLMGPLLRGAEVGLR
ncbi:MCE family protein [Kutzneria albida]|uniref:ABC transporter substrate-binding protein n=1 Tax=Kutzneria albida DSM 43870 TaxID=1449976 RepID=W5WF50_9PSEU|nr:MCE family protein [Kutzneria albida]AHH96789.1 ABC transporter substrate-binding protein [Kutzneria albida DSM 43870]